MPKKNYVLYIRLLIIDIYLLTLLSCNSFVVIIISIIILICLGELLFREFKLAGVNRLSLGVQSLRDADLRLMNRDHTVAEALT